MTVQAVQATQVPNTNGLQWVTRWLAVAHFTNDFFSGSLPVIMVAQDEQLHLSDAEFAAIPSIFLGISILQPFIGWLSDKMHHSYLMLSGGFITALGVLMVALSGSYELMILGALLGGIGNAMFHPFALASARAFAGQNASGRSIALFMFGGNGAFAIGPLVSAWFLQSFGLPSIAILVTLCGVLVPTVIWRIRPLMLDDNIIAKPVLKKKNNKTSTAQDTLIKAGQIALMVVVVYLMVVLFRSTVQQSFSTFLPKFYKDQDRTLVFAGFATTILLFSAAIGSYIGAALSDFISRKLIIGGSMVALTPLTLLLLRADGVWIFVLSVLVGMMVNANWPLLLMIGQEVLPGGAIGSSGFAFGWGFLAAAIGSYIVGNLADAIGLAEALEVMAFMPLPAAFLVFMFPRQVREDDEESAPE